MDSAEMHIKGVDFRTRLTGRVSILYGLAPYVENLI